TLPAVAMSSFVLILAPLFFFAKKIKLNEKLAYAMLVIILVVSFEIPMVNYLWHGMSAPACFPYRFAFVYAFILMIIAYKAFLNIREMPKWAIAIPSALITGLYVYAFITTEKSQITNLIISATFSAVFVVLIILMQNVKKGKLAMSIVALLCVASEIIACNYNMIRGYETDQYAPYHSEVANVKAELSKNNEKFYRMEFVDSNDTFISAEELAQSYGMAASLYGYNGVSTFSSLADWKFSSSQFAFGNNGNSGNAFGYAMQTPLYNMMFGIEYIMDNTNVLKENKHYELAVDNGKFKTYKNSDYVGLGMMTTDKIKEWTPFAVNAFASQASLWNVITNETNPFNSVEPTDIEYIGCKAVGFDEAKAAGEDQIIHKHDHEHEHEGEVEVEGEEKEEHQSAFDILKQIGGTYLYKRTNQNEFSIKLCLTPEKSQNLYINYNSGTFNKMAVVSDKTGEMNFKLGGKGLVDIGYRSAGEKITVTLSASSYEGFKENDLSHDDAVYFVAMGIDEEIFDDGMKTIRENGVFNLTEFKETNVKGTVNAKNDGYLMMSMPYDEGWTIFVDGKETEIFENAAHIMTFPVTKGEHTIEMKYFPLGLRDGLFVSGGSILALALSVLVIKMRKERFLEEEKTEENPDGEIQE
ncbi:MAG: YfhO family protein, partial [Oscillospiraceae bacterium]